MKKKGWEEKGRERKGREEKEKKRKNCLGEFGDDRDAFGRNPDAFEMAERALAPSEILGWRS